MEQRLDPAQFVRIHRSTIVQLDCIDRLLQRSAADYTVQLDNAKTFRVSRSRQDDLLRRLETGAPPASS
jgi:two-component system LytT family response regulator